MLNKSIVTLTVIAALGASSLAQAQPAGREARQDAREARQDMREAQRDLNHARNPREAREARQDRREAQRDLREARQDQWQARRYYNARGPEFRRGHRLPPELRERYYVVNDWRGHRLSPPPRGYQWVQVGPDYVLAAVATGLILNMILSQ